jgi:CHAT domain-containing protein
MTLRNKALISIAFLVPLLMLSGCGVLFHSRGLTLAASGNYSQVVKEFEPADKNYSAMSFSKVIYLCQAYGRLKNYQNLFPCIDAAQARVEAGDYRADLWNHSALPSRMKAAAYIELGQYEDAIQAAEASYSMTIQKQLMEWDQAQSLEVLGMSYGLSGKNEEAEQAISKINRIIRSGALGGMTDSLYMALARIYMTLHRYQDAVNVLSYKYEESGALAKTLTGWDVFTTEKIQFEFMKYKSLFETSRMAKAKEGYDALLRYPYIALQGEIYWNVLFDRGRIAELEGRLKEAIDLYSKAIDIVEQQRASINTEASKIGFVGDKQSLYHALVRALYQDNQYEKAFEYVERAKSRALVDLLASKKDFVVKGKGDQEIRGVLARNDRAEAEALMQDAPVGRSKTRSVQITTREELQHKAPELASLVTVTSQSLVRLKSLIPSDEALVEYYYRDRDLYVFVLSKGAMHMLKLDSGDLPEDIRQFRMRIEALDSAELMNISRKLYTRLFQPLERIISERKIIIVPHGALHYLPMNALHDGSGYLIDRYSIRLMPSASVLQYLRASTAEKAGGILIFGNPDLGDPRTDLEYAQKEATEIARIRPDSRVLLRKEATESALRRYSEDYRYLHFATHGQFNREAPLKSALLLAPDARSDGMLTVDKLYSLHLNANLVTLSACETGMSKIATGDDMVGLTRGFLYAGSSSIVASLWKVDDLATAFLMTLFYKELDTGNTGHALRTAQLETKKKYPHPYYWASFQLTGNAK